MDKKALLEQFEQTKTYDLCKSWQIDFDEKAEIYYSINPAYHNDVIALNAAWSMFQEQQAKVEELQKRLYGALKETQYALQYVEGDMRGNHEFLKMAMIRTFKALEQALKGEG